MPKQYMSDEIYKEDKAGDFIPEKVIRIGFGKAITILVGAVLASAGSAVWATLAVANTIPLRVVALEAEVTKIESQFMPLQLSTEKWKNNDYQHAEIIRRLDAIQTTLGRL
jgi:hypothetical protein